MSPGTGGGGGGRVLRGFTCDVLQWRLACSGADVTVFFVSLNSGDVAAFLLAGGFGLEDEGGKIPLGLAGFWPKHLFAVTHTQKKMLLAI